jgi:hypothetical protein
MFRHLLALFRLMTRSPRGGLFIFICFFLIYAESAAQEGFFWGNPELFAQENSGFPQSVSCNEFGLVAWQETDSHGENPIRSYNGYGNIYISVAVSLADSGEWTTYHRVAGPFPYAGMEPSIFSVNIDNSGRILLCVAASTSVTEVYISDNRGVKWTKHTVNTFGVTTSRLANVSRGKEINDTLVPRIFQTAGGSYLMFIVRNIGRSIALCYARSEDCRQWTAFQSFAGDDELLFNFLPCYLSFQGKDIIVFQSFVASKSTYQLFMKSSGDNGRTWSSIRRITDFEDPLSNTAASPDMFNNERPNMTVYDNSIFLVWERTYIEENSPSIYGVLMNESGVIKSPPERINEVQAKCNNPIAWIYNGERNVLWFDNRHGSYGVVNAYKTENFWQNREMSVDKNISVFPRLVQAGKASYIFWQDITGDNSKILVISRDIFTESPDIFPLNFVTGKRISSDVARISWTVPYDSSGIEGFSWSWNRDPEAEPPEDKMFWANTTEISETADEDGPWYFKIRALDFAGNWSKPSGVVFVRHRTPPPPVEFVTPLLDGNGFLPSNTFSIRWAIPDSDYIAGYYWMLDYMGPAGSHTPVPVSRSYTGKPPAAIKILGTDNRASFVNRDNGLWRVTVYSIDDVGNVSEARSIYFKLNKYIPHTYITYLDAEQELMGDLNLTVIGRGFAENGNVSKVYFNREGADGYERVLTLGDGEFVVENDREIAVRRVENLPAGNYYISIEHPVRGLAQSPHTITVGRSLTYKFGDFTRFWETSWMVKLYHRFVFDVWTVVFTLIILFCAVVFVFTVRGTMTLFVERRAIQLETAALLNGNEMPMAKKRKLKGLKRRGAGLRLKLMMFTIILVSIIVGIVSTPLYLIMSANQRRTLMNSLWERSSVLIESVTQSASAFLAVGNDGLPNILELGFLPQQAENVSEAQYITITGFSSRNSLTSDYIWASNDPGIREKIDTAELQEGVSRITDSVSDTITALEDDLNALARERVGALTESISELYREGMHLAAQSDENSRRQLERIQNSLRGFNTRIKDSLNKISGTVYADPEFDLDTDKIEDKSYLLYKPVMFRQSGSDIYVRGWVRLEITSKHIAEIIKEDQRKILIIILFIAFTAVALGVILSFIIASLIVLPLHSLVKHVELIRDTDDKTKLAGHEIAKKSSDEIGILSETINDMTHGLVKAALANQEVSIGKEIQKKFIPLEVDSKGNKLTTGYTNTKNAEFFGYYEGAKGVSGDYFDYRDLDGRYYAVIKCDVAGKGIPAALIMIQVATMFINYFRRWKPNEESMHIENLVYQINSFIEELGFKGRFAAFTLCLFDSETGLVRFCNAGDNQIHYYDASERKVKMISLPQTPATGVLPNFMVEMKGGYTVQTLTLDHGDILLLYTDGIEEAKRLFRNKNYEEIVCKHQGMPAGSEHGNHVVGENGEEFGAIRVEGVVNAVMNREEYLLRKYHNPNKNFKYNFDFSICAGSVEEIIMALASIEKVFRMCKNFQKDIEKKILVDKKIDAFLQKHFNEYDVLIGEKQEYTENEGYVYYNNLYEDEQYDDLTMLGIKRK